MTDQPINPGNDVETQLRTLNASNKQLSIDVRALTDAVMLVQKLDAEQQEMKLKAAEAEKRIAEVDLVTQDKINRTRRAGIVAAAFAAVVIPVVSILVYLALINHVNQLLDEQREQAAALQETANRNSFTSCTTRNMAAVENAQREEELAKIETDPRVVRIHAESAAKLRTTLNDCSKYQKKAPSQ